MLLNFLLEFQNTVRMTHWQTKLYSLHQTTESLYETVDGLVDRYAEVFIGKNGIDHLPFNIKVRHLDSKLFIEYLKFSYSKIVKYAHAIEDVDLLHIRDEILESISKAIYLAIKCS